MKTILQYIYEYLIIGSKLFNMHFTITGSDMITKIFAKFLSTFMGIYHVCTQINIFFSVFKRILQYLICQKGGFHERRSRAFESGWGIEHSDSNFTNIKILVRWVGVYKFLNIFCW